MNPNIKGFELFLKLYKNNLTFQKLILTNLENGKVRYFGEEEWNKMLSQNFVPPVFEMKTFYEMFMYGYNIGNCVGVSMQLSYS